MNAPSASDHPPSVHHVAGLDRPDRHHPDAVDAALHAAGQVVGLPCEPATCEPVPGAGHVHLHGDLALHAMMRRIETNVELVEFVANAERAGVPTPALVAHGVHDGVPWNVTQRLRPHAEPMNLREQAVEHATLLYRLHRLGEPAPGAKARSLHDERTQREAVEAVEITRPDLAELMVQLSSEAISGARRTVVHGDSAIGHNTMVASDGRLWLFDPAQFGVACAEFDLAVADGFSLRGDDVAARPVSRYYPGRLELDRLAQFTQLMLLRRAFFHRRAGLDQATNDAVGLLRADLRERLLARP